MKIDVLTLFPSMYDNFINESIIKRAIEKKQVEINIHNIRDYTVYKNNQVDNNYDEESDTYEYSLPEVSVNNRDNLDLVYNKANEYKSTVGKEFYNMIKSLVK